MENKDYQYLPPSQVGEGNVLTHVCLFVSRIAQKVTCEFS